MFAEFTNTIHHDVYPAINPNTTLSGSMTGKNVIITGGGRGIGRAIAQSFAIAGAKGIFLVSRTEEQLLETGRLIHEKNPDVIVGFHAGSIADDEIVKQIYNKATGLLGDLHVLVNCAADSENYAPLAQIDPKIWWSTITTICLGTFLMSTNFINLPSHPERRVIINIGSNAAVEPIVIPFHCPSGYTIGKTAFIRLSRITLSSRGIWANRGIEYLHDENSRSGVNTYLFHPGAVLTDLLRDKMPSGSEQMAVDSPFLAGGLAVWFASELSDEKINRGWLGGRYISAIWDVNEILEREKEIVEKDLLRMRLDM